MRGLNLLESSAVFSPCRRYRYSLTRRWQMACEEICECSVCRRTADDYPSPCTDAPCVLCDHNPTTGCERFAPGSGDTEWRRRLAGNMVAFIGLNPSTADETVNDPTVTRCMGYARRWGYSGMIMLNLFAYRATDPQEMKRQADPVGPANDFHLLLNCCRVQRVVCCWGNHGQYMGRAASVRQLLQMDVNGLQPHYMATALCLVLTSLGEPEIGRAHV